MTFTAFTLIFLSVFLHVTWNFLSKSTRPSLAFHVLMAATACICWIPFFVCSPWKFSQLPASFLWCIAGSILFEVFYIFGLSYAYRKGDISMIYPLVRAIPVLLIPLVTVTLNMGKIPTPLAFAGMGIIVAGCLLMPLNKLGDFRLANYMKPALLLVLLAAIGSTGYTIFDSQSMEIIRHSLQRNHTVDLLGYLCIIEGGITISLGILTLCNRQERENFRFLFPRNYKPCLAGISSSVSYGLVLAAMPFVTNLSYLQAFRQLSLPLGFLAGILFLKESRSLPKIISIILILSGLLLVSLG